MSPYLDLYNTNEHGLIARDFICNDAGSVLNDYLCYNAHIDKAKGLGTTHVLIGENEEIYNKIIIGFFVLRNTSFVTDRENGKLIGEPALEISEFAVHKVFERQHMGTKMISAIITMAKDFNSKFSGIKYLVLCAVPDAIEFYEKLNFKRLDNYGHIPTEQWSQDCTPMYMIIHET